MKILILQDYLRSGGTERQSVLLANAFAADGHEATLLTFRPGGRLADTVAPAVARPVLQRRDLGLDWFAPGLHRAVAHTTPDLILCMGRMANCYAGGVQEKFPTVPVVGSMRTGKPLPWLYRRSLRRVRHVVANSREAADTLQRDHGVPPERLSVIYNSLVFPAAGAAGAERERLRREHGATAATTVLLCVAMLRPEKRQAELIEIAAGLPPELDWQLWLAGDGTARAACARLAATRGLGGRVRLLGFCPRPAPLYAAADVAVHASESEALSNFLIEAQAHGLPAVAYEAQGIRECFMPDRTGWAIARDDRAGFRARLVALAGQPAADRAGLAAAAQAYARATFDPARQVAAYLTLFQRLLGRPTRHDEQTAHRPDRATHPRA